MGIDESEISRLLAGEVPADDPQLGKVSAFLGSLEASCPPSNVDALADRHLAVVAREVRLVGNARARDRGTAASRATTRTRRALAAMSAGLLVVLTAGVGVASALGVNPLQLVPGLVKSWTSPASPTSTPEPTGQGTAGPGNTPRDASRPPVVDPTEPPTAGQPTVAPTPGNCGNGQGDGNATCTNGKSGNDNPGKGKPTAKPTPKATGKPSDKGKGHSRGGDSGNEAPGKGAGKGKPTPGPTP